jgi:hypothetical protein
VVRAAPVLVGGRAVGFLWLPIRWSRPLAIGFCSLGLAFYAFLIESIGIKPYGIFYFHLPLDMLPHLNNYCNPSCIKYGVIVALLFGSYSLPLGPDG